MQKKDSSNHKLNMLDLPIQKLFYDNSNNINNNEMKWYKMLHYSLTLQEAC